jgi:hypothetical protein
MRLTRFASAHCQTCVICLYVGGFFVDATDVWRVLQILRGLALIIAALKSAPPQTKERVIMPSV